MYAAFLLLVITTLINTLARVMIMHVSKQKIAAKPAPRQDAGVVAANTVNVMMAMKH